MLLLSQATPLSPLTEPSKLTGNTLIRFGIRQIDISFVVVSEVLTEIQGVSVHKKLFVFRVGGFQNVGLDLIPPMGGLRRVHADGQYSADPTKLLECPEAQLQPPQ